MMHRNRSVDVHQFAMVPRADIPRSVFDRQFTHKTTFDAGYLVPIYCDEVLPGDAFRVSCTAFARLATPLYPVMDNLHMDFFFFFVPNRLVWSNWKKFMGEQATPASSISFTIPQMVSKASGYDIGSLQDYFGLPTLGQVTAAQTVSHSALPLRAYNLIWNEWFRDENLQDSVVVDLGDSASVYTDYSLLRRGKRHDYFTSALPSPQKGSTAVTVPMAGSATVMMTASTGATVSPLLRRATTHALEATTALQSDSNANLNAVTGGNALIFDPNGTLYADLGTATSVTLNQFRTAIQTQAYLERDARGGTRYTEKVRSHFGVVSPDARLQRPEYLGGGSVPVVINPITQNTQSGLTGGSTPMGTLAAVGSAVSRVGFSQSFTEHGYVIGLVSVRADLTYQQGIEKHWLRSTVYDYYFPVFANLGEQSILNKEIYCKGDATAADSQVFGYQERWAEYRYKPSMITGLFRSTAASTIDPWHLSQKFTSLPTLNTTFIQETPPVSRVVAVGASANGQQFIFDSMFSVRSARPMPLYSVPASLGRF